MGDSFTGGQMGYAFEFRRSQGTETSMETEVSFQLSDENPGDQVQVRHTSVSIHGWPLIHSCMHPDPPAPNFCLGLEGGVVGPL